MEIDTLIAEIQDKTETIKSLKAKLKKHTTEYDNLRKWLLIKMLNRKLVLGAKK